MADRRWSDGEMPTIRDPPEQQGAPPPVVDLAREPPFPLGLLKVDPATRRVSQDEWSTQIEPRAMQVLVILAQGMPGVVGRDALNLRAWGGRIVGNDAINRAIQTLRRLASDAPGPLPFTIETIPRVGYRLAVTPSDPQVEAPISFRTDREATPRSHRHLIVSGFGVVVVLGLASWVGTARPGQAVSWHIAGTSSIGDMPTDADDLAPSPDGRWFAYRSLDGRKRSRIFVRAASGGGTAVRISPADVDARRPSWSLDGTMLAFATFAPDRPCEIFIRRVGETSTRVGSCETVREPTLTWSVDGKALLLGDAPGVNAVQRITSINLASAERSVVISPPGDSMGDDLPQARGQEIIFRRHFGYADEGWIARDPATGQERTLWRRARLAGSAAASLPDGTLAIAWTRSGSSRLDIIQANGHTATQPLTVGSVTAISASGSSLIIESDRKESALFRAGAKISDATKLAAARGRITGPQIGSDRQLRFPVNFGGDARIVVLNSRGTLKNIRVAGATSLAGLAQAPHRALTAAMIIGDAGREIIVLHDEGMPAFRWNPKSRSINPGAWISEGRELTVPVLDGAGWRLMAVDPFNGRTPRDLRLPGFAVVLARGNALYGVRAGESTGIRELWRLDGSPRRLPINLTLLDIVNWCSVDQGIWLPDRSDPKDPQLTLRDEKLGRVLRRVSAPDLAGPGSGMTADDSGPIYVSGARQAPEYTIINLIPASTPSPN